MSKWNDQQSRRLVTTSHLPIQGNWDIFLFVTSSLPTLLVKKYALRIYYFLHLPSGVQDEIFTAH